MSYIGTEPKDVRSFGRAKFDYTASQGQTAFTGADDDSKTLAFTDGQIEVHVNGILMDESDFSTSNGNTVTLASAANLNDIVSITALQTDIPNSDYVPATGGTFTGDVDFGSNKITYANLYNNVSDLPSASTYHGMFAHVHNTGLAYYSHAGAWIPLANLTGATFSGNIVASDGINLGGTGASNKLDDYEEGTWTPAYGTTGTGFTSVSYQAQTGTYTKIGNMVTLVGTLDINSGGLTKGSASGGVLITGQPFTAVDSIASYSGSLSQQTQWTQIPTQIFASDDDTLRLGYINSNDSETSYGVIDPADMNGSGRNRMRFTITYMTSQ